MKLYQKEVNNLNYRELNDNEILSYISEGNEIALNLIYEKYKPLINKIATNMHRRYCSNTSLEKNDLIQEGMLALNSAINHFKEQKDTLFYTYAKTCIERKIISVVIGAHRQKNKPLNESISVEFSNTDDLRVDVLLKDNHMNPENIIIDRENESELLDKINESLTDLEQQILQLKMDGFEYKEIALIVNKDEKSVDNAIQRIRNKIKKIVNEI